MPDEPAESPESLGEQLRRKIQQTHTYDQLTGHMRATATAHTAYFDELLKHGMYRHEALDLTRVLVAENFRAVYTAKPTTRPKPE